ncbi:MAG: electron transport complex subunit RsxC [Tissierellia bacterium]|nr:electron transport complex subunit RsxC [Tissierellia bacterium]
MSLEDVTFKGGVHMHDFKELTCDKPVKTGISPKSVTIALQQHIGVTCESLVKRGDRVLVGEKIGESKAFMSVPVHSSVSGTVKSIDDITSPAGMRCKAVTIESDGLDEIGYEIVNRSIDEIKQDEIVPLIKEAGITGLGGAAFPTHIKLSPPEDIKIDTVIINGAECEPYLTADQKIMEIHPENVVGGLKLAMKAVNAEKGYICIETNKPGAIKAISEVVKGEENIKVLGLKPKYPQGDEKRLIDATTKRHVPSGGLPMDVGVVVINAYTSNCIYEAITTGKPLYERIVTVTGSAVKEPTNVMARIGVPLKYLLEEAEGFKEKPGKIIVGGPMMGETQFTIDAPMVKATGGVLCLTEEEAKPEKVQSCIKCGKCLTVCPVFLQPLYLESLVRHGVYEGARDLNIMDCIECGSCSYICPAKRPLVESIRMGKRELKKKTQRV